MRRIHVLYNPVYDFERCFIFLVFSEKDSSLVAGIFPVKGSIITLIIMVIYSTIGLVVKFNVAIVEPRVRFSDGAVRLSVLGLRGMVFLKQC